MTLRSRTTSILLAGGLAALALPASAAPEKRPLRPADIFALKDVSAPAISPDGQLVIYEVASLDATEDAADTDVWLSPLAGGDALRLTTSPKSEASPRWSPDGRFIAFLADRDGTGTQVWLLDRRGGEATRLTDYKASVSALAWSPDGGRLALVVKDVDQGDSEAAGKTKRPKPIVIRRLQFKKDGETYLGELRHHIHVFDVVLKASVQVTSGAYDDAEPVWSPDGHTIAFTSNRTADPDANDNTDVFLVEAKAKAEPRRLTTSPGAESAPAFSPDGRTITFVGGADPKDIWYGTLHVGVVPVVGGPETFLTRALDRVVSTPRFSPDGQSILFLVEEGGNSHLARIPVAGGDVERVVDGERDVQAFDVAPGGEIVVLASEPQLPSELFAVAGGELKRITHANDAFLQGIALGSTERFKATSRDGTTVDGFLVRPPVATTGKLPTILRIHGGPNGQDSTAFNLEWQMLAAQGYAVVSSNPRGSTGYGEEFSRAIFGDWGNKDYDDVMAALDHVIEMGVADPARLGVGGWSYGGMMTDFVITKTDRFKAAIAGASEANAFANYGTDEYQRAWEIEAGLPWRNVETWMRLSPWFQIEKVTTPTLFIGGLEDHNVPFLNSEQLYQALRRLGKETELVAYPGEYHGIERPSFLKDRFERYIAWYDAHLKPAATPHPGGAR